MSGNTKAGLTQAITYSRAAKRGIKRYWSYLLQSAHFSNELPQFSYRDAINNCREHLSEEIKKTRACECDQSKKIVKLSLIQN